MIFKVTFVVVGNDARPVSWSELIIQVPFLSNDRIEKLLSVLGYWLLTILKLQFCALQSTRHFLSALIYFQNDTGCFSQLLKVPSAPLHQMVQ